MSLAQAVSLTDRQVEGLMRSYIERKRFEAKIMLSVIGEALKSPKREQASLASLAAMGFGIHVPKNRLS